MDPKEPPLKPAPDRRKRREPYTSRRRSFRSQWKVPVVVKWTSEDGSPQEEATETTVINSHGCQVPMQAELLEGLSVELENRNTNEIRRGEVVWCGGVDPDGRNQVAIAVEEPDPKFWGERYVSFLLWAAMRTT